MVKTETIFLSTSSLFRFSKNLKGLKPLISILAKEKMEHLVMKAKEAYKDLCMKQEVNLKNHSPKLMQEENTALRRWDWVTRLEEKYLKQKSKLHWLQVIDKNNKIFHRAVTTREAKNSIMEIECSDGRILSREDDIKVEAERFFSDFLQLIPRDFK